MKTAEKTIHAPPGRIGEKVVQLPVLCAEQGLIMQNRDGNFLVQRQAKHSNKKLDSRIPFLSRTNFARIFGRIPVNGINLRADVFLRLVRLGGCKISIAKKGEEAVFPAMGCPLMRTFQVGYEPNSEAFGLFLNDEGNFNLKPLPHGCPGTKGEVSMLISFNEFEMMFGLDTRDYFANEAIRIASLAGYEVRLCTK